MGKSAKSEAKVKPGRRSRPAGPAQPAQPAKSKRVLPCLSEEQKRFFFFRAICFFTALVHTYD
jgi:hypothetical protein